MNATQITISFTSQEIAAMKKAAKEADKNFDAEIENAVIRHILAQEGVILEVKSAVRAL